MRRFRRNWLQSLDRVGKSRWLPASCGLWVVIVGCYFNWETLEYLGITRELGEWEYGNWGRYLPWLTYLLLVLVFTVPVLVPLAYLRRRVRRSLNLDAGAIVASVVRSEKALFNFLALCSGAILIIGLFALMGAMGLPQMAETTRVVTVRAGSSKVERGGPARLTGYVLYGRTAKYQRDFFLMHSATYYAPVVGTAAGNEAGRYFVEIPINTTSIEQQTKLMSYTGILQRYGLPGPIRVLYKGAGIEVADPYYVLFTSRAAMGWPYYQLRSMRLQWA